MASGSGTNTDMSSAGFAPQDPRQGSRLDLSQWRLTRTKPTFADALGLLLPTFIRGGGFHRSDYRIFRWINNSILKDEHWPVWKPALEAPPPNFPFPVEQLGITCQNFKFFARKFRAEPLDIDSNVQHGQWVMTMTIPHECHNTEASLKARRHLQFFECQGYKLGLDVDRILKAENHGPNHWVCSDCAYHEYIVRDMTMWHHSRLLMFCRDCCIGPQTNYFATVQKYPICNCHQIYAPNLHNNRYHLCGHCRQEFADQQRRRMYHKILELFPSLKMRDPNRRPAPAEPYNLENFVWDRTGPNMGGADRQFCLCGKTTQQIAQTWTNVSPADKGREFLRLCLLCGGHQPTATWIKAEPTTCL